MKVLYFLIRVKPVSFTVPSNEQYETYFPDTRRFDLFAVFGSVFSMASRKCSSGLKMLHRPLLNMKDAASFLDLG